MRNLKKNTNMKIMKDDIGSLDYGNVGSLL